AVLASYASCPLPVISAIVPGRQHAGLRLKPSAPGPPQLLLRGTSTREPLPRTGCGRSGGEPRDVVLFVVYSVIRPAGITPADLLRAAGGAQFPPDLSAQAEL